MRVSLVPFKRVLPDPARQRGAWLRDESGSAAVEFALVAVPFFLFVFGIIGVGLYFFTQSALDRGLENAARKIRTGEAQQAAVTVGQFKTSICTEAGTYIDCSKVSVIVQSASDWSGISPLSCVDSNNNMVGSTGATGDLISKYSGASKTVVLVTVCYKWDLAQMFSFLKLGSGPGGTGAAVVQAATTFRSEPYS
jgi:Flp pilus assembly protein TadG